MIGGLISLAGVVLPISRGSIATLLGLELNTGDLWMLLAVLSWSLYTAFLQWRPQGVQFRCCCWRPSSWWASR